MNTILKSAVIASAFVLPVLAGTASSHQQGSAGGGMMMGPDMMGQQMMQMRERMQENHALMEKIVTEKNADKRKQMLQEHMQSMQRQMEGMNKLMADELAGGTPSEKMDERMDMMDMRMNMMQMMMEQMMDYQHQAN